MCRVMIDDQLNMLQLQTGCGHLTTRANHYAWVCERLHADNFLHVLFSLTSELSALNAILSFTLCSGSQVFFMQLTGSGCEVGDAEGNFFGGCKTKKHWMTVMAKTCVLPTHEELPWLPSYRCCTWGAALQGVAVTRGAQACVAVVSMKVGELIWGLSLTLGSWKIGFSLFGAECTFLWTWHKSSWLKYLKKTEQHVTHGRWTPVETTF